MHFRKTIMTLNLGICCFVLYLGVVNLIRQPINTWYILFGVMTTFISCLYWFRYYSQQYQALGTMFKVTLYLFVLSVLAGLTYWGWFAWNW